MAQLWPDIPTRIEIGTNGNVALSVPLSCCNAEATPERALLSWSWMAVPLHREPPNTSIKPSVWTLMSSLLPTTKLCTKVITASTVGTHRPTLSAQKYVQGVRIVHRSKTHLLEICFPVEKVLARSRLYLSPRSMIRPNPTESSPGRPSSNDRSAIGEKCVNMISEPLSRAVWKECT